MYYYGFEQLFSPPPPKLFNIGPYVCELISKAPFLLSLEYSKTI